MANDIGKRFDSSNDTIDTDALNVGDTLTFASIAQKDYVDALLSTRNLKVVLTSAGHYGVWAGNPRHTCGGRRTGKMAFAKPCALCDLPRAK